MLRVGQARVARAARIGARCAACTHLPFGDRRFDVTVSVRMHIMPDWRATLTELCRARAAAHDIRRGAARRDPVGGPPGAARRRPIDRAVSRSATAPSTRCRAAGFRVHDRHRHFVPPIAAQAVARGFTRGSESALRAAGVTALFGSPVTLVAEREA
jgi:hypothetical protein